MNGLELPLSEVRVDQRFTASYEDDYFGDPWRESEVVLLVHGAGESSKAWYAWVPHLARHYRVIRMDLRGLGASSPPPEGYVWTLPSLASDILGFMDALGLDRVHLVAAKIGGTIALQFALQYPKRLRSLSVVTAPVRKGQANDATKPDQGAAIIAGGTRAWAESTQRARLGSVPDGQIDWWNDLMASSNPYACAGYATMMGRLDNHDTLASITVPTLVVAVAREGADGAANVPDWQRTIPGSELHVIRGEGYHVAASHPDECAISVLDFINRYAGEQD
jgi:pimeloyl-ACP methyl ester carboxylesterase